MVQTINPHHHHHRLAGLPLAPLLLSGLEIRRFRGLLTASFITYSRGDRGQGPLYVGTEGGGLLGCTPVI